MSTETHETPISATPSTRLPPPQRPALQARPDAVFARRVFTRRMLFPDGVEHDVRGLESDSSGRGLPGPVVRVTEGQVVRLTVDEAAQAVYQWRLQPGVPGQAGRGSAGSGLYRAEGEEPVVTRLGTFGPMVVDPVVHPDHPVPSGTRRAFADGPAYDVATEQVLVPYAVDQRWQRLAHAALAAGHREPPSVFEPRHFYLLGGLLSAPRRAEGVWSLRRLQVSVRGFPTLVRVLSASTLPVRLRCTDHEGRPLAMAELVAQGGRPLRAAADPDGLRRPLREQDGVVLTDRVGLAAHDRYDVLLHPTRALEPRVHVDWCDPVTREVLGTVSVPVLLV